MNKDKEELPLGEDLEFEGDGFNPPVEKNEKGEGVEQIELTNSQFEELCPVDPEFATYDSGESVKLPPVASFENNYSGQEIDEDFLATEYFLEFLQKNKVNDMSASNATSIPQEGSGYNETNPLESNMVSESGIAQNENPQDDEKRYIIENDEEVNHFSYTGETANDKEGNSSSVDNTYDRDSTGETNNEEEGEEDKYDNVKERGNLKRLTWRRERKKIVSSAKFQDMQRLAQSKSDAKITNFVYNRRSFYIMFGIGKDHIFEEYKEDIYFHIIPKLKLRKLTLHSLESGFHCTFCRNAKSKCDYNKIKRVCSECNKRGLSCKFEDFDGEELEKPFSTHVDFDTLKSIPRNKREMKHETMARMCCERRKDGKNFYDFFSGKNVYFAHLEKYEEIKESISTRKRELLNKRKRGDYDEDVKRMKVDDYTTRSFRMNKDNTRNYCTIWRFDYDNVGKKMNFYLNSYDSRLQKIFDENVLYNYNFEENVIYLKRETEGDITLKLKLNIDYDTLRCLCAYNPFDVILYIEPDEISL